MSEINEHRAAIDAEVARLNDAVTAALNARTAYMDAHMAEYAKYPVGTELFTRDGRSLGMVSGHYRYHAHQSPLDDTSMSIHYRFENGDNTSRQMLGEYALFDREELARSLRQRAAALVPPQ